MVERHFTVLGSASSPGVPRINGDWGACNPDNPKNRRRRVSFLVEQINEEGGKTTVVIDTGPDFREQMIMANVKHLDAVLYTHAHADHIHGIDDLRGFFHTQRHRIPVYAEPYTLERLMEGFGYCFVTPEGSLYPPIAKASLIETPDTPVMIEGAGGAIEFMPLLQTHGSIHSYGFRVGNVAYCPDVSDFPEATVAKMQGLDLLIIDALQDKPHSSHLSLAQALEWIERLKPKHAVLTHMHTPLDYDDVMARTPAHVEPAYDGLKFKYNI